MKKAKNKNDRVFDIVGYSVEYLLWRNKKGFEDTLLT